MFCVLLVIVASVIYSVSVRFCLMLVKIVSNLKLRVCFQQRPIFRLTHKYPRYSQELTAGRCNS